MKILHLEDDSFDAELVECTLAAEIPHCTIVAAVTRAEFLAHLTTEPPDLILSDSSVPAFSGLEALALTRESAPQIPFIFFSGMRDEERALAAARAGAYDYVVKDDLARLPAVVRRAFDESIQRRDRKAD